MPDPRRPPASAHPLESETAPSGVDAGHEAAERERSSDLQSEGNDAIASEADVDVEEPLSPSSLKDVRTAEQRARAMQQHENRDVWLHVYHCDPYTGLLNQLMLKQAEIGIYHAGLEVFGEEWSFQYFEDTWNDPSVSGLIRCLPKRMSGYEYQESLNLGPTPLSREEVDRLLFDLHRDWPACSYHLTHNNCLTFAEHLAGLLRAPKPFPARLKGILEASRKNSSVDAVVDYGWSWSKWFMIRKHRRPEDERSQETALVERDNEQGYGLWSLLLQPGQTCSGSLCLKGPSKSLPGSRERCVCPTPAVGLPLR